MVSFPSSLVGFFRVPFLHALVFIQKILCDFFCTCQAFSASCIYPCDPCCIHYAFEQKGACPTGAYKPLQNFLVMILWDYVPWSSYFSAWWQGLNNWYSLPSKEDPDISLSIVNSNDFTNQELLNHHLTAAHKLLHKWTKFSAYWSSKYIHIQVSYCLNLLDTCGKFNLVAMAHFAALNDHAQLTPFYPGITYTK